jgi:hypothetical protein
VFSPDGKTLATTRFPAGTDALEVVLWEVATGKERYHLKQSGQVVTAVAFSPDGSLIATASATRDNPIGPPEAIVVWDADTGKETGRLTGHRATVEALAFSPDGNVLVSGSCDTTILFWDLWSAIARPKPATDRLPSDRLDQLWSDFKHDDAPRAHQAIAIAAKHPNDSVPFLRRSIFPGPAPDPALLTRLIGELDDDNFAVREKASAELARLGFPAGLALREGAGGEALRGSSTAAQGADGPA